MEHFLRNQLRQHPEVSPHINMYMFEHKAPLVEVSELNQKVEAQTKTLSQTEKTCRELWPRFDSLTEKANNLGRNRMRWRVRGRLINHFI